MKVKCLSRDYLKIIAFVTMLIDHVGFVFVDRGSELYAIMRSVGRMSFPIFLVLFVDGLLRTKHLSKHIVMLGVFACISEIPYDLAFSGFMFDWGSQNVFWSWFFGAILLGMFLWLEQNHDILSISKEMVCFLQLLIMMVMFVVCFYLKLDYDKCCMLVIAMCYFAIQRFRAPLWLACGLVCAILVGTYQTWFAFLAVIPFLFYNPDIERRLSLKYLYYVGYPAHLLAFGLGKYVFHVI